MKFFNTCFKRFRMLESIYVEITKHLVENFNKNQEKENENGESIINMHHI